MFVRKIKAEELLTAEKIGSIAFEFSPKKTTLEERLKQIKEKPTSRADYYSLSRWAAFDNDGSMMGSIATYPYEILFDGKQMGMSGIGFVSTLPGYRRRGVIRKCFESAFLEMKQLSQAFSALYPFSANYYRQFGYEVAPQTTEWTIPMECIPSFTDVTGSYHLYEPGEDLSDFHEVYRNFAKNYSLMAVREDVDFASYTENPIETKTYWYLYKNQKGEPKGYLRFYKDTSEKERSMCCSTNFRNVEFCFSDTEGLKGLLQFAKSFSADYDCITLSLPTNIPLHLYLGETNKIKRANSFAGMYRVVDVEKVLYAARYKGSGRICLHITDSYMPWNHGYFLVEFEEGKAKNIQKSEHGCADLSMGIGDFTRLIVGCFEKEQIRMMPHVEIHHDTPMIDQIFYQKPIWIHDFF